MAVDLRKCYKILGLNFGASQSQIKKAYHALAKEKHPDKIQQKLGRPATATETEAWKPIQEAYDILTGKSNPGGGGGQAPNHPPKDDCNRCGKKYDFDNRFKGFKKGKGESDNFWFCSKKCYNCFNVCNSCGKIEKLSPEEEKNSKIWKEKGWGSTKGKIFCSSQCKQKLQQNPNNFDSESLPNCHHCGEKFRISHIDEEGKGIYTTYAYTGRSEIFCSAKCREEWGKANLEGQGTNTEMQQTNTSNNGNRSGGRGSGTNEDNGTNDNSESESDHGSDNKGEENNNSLPEDIQKIANLSLSQSKEQAKNKIKKLLSENSLSEEDLGTENWPGSDSWESYLEGLDTSQKVAEFTENVRQSVLKKLLDRETSTSNQKKKPDDNLLPIITFTALSCLILTILIIIIRKRKRQKF